MHKHVLFLPAMRILAAIAGLFATQPLRILSIAFSLVGAANLVLAAASIRLCGFKPSQAGLLTALYGGCFSIITYSSLFDTYIFSSCLVNLLLLLSLRLTASPNKRTALWAAVCCGLLPLATWQLAAFMPAFLFWHALSLYRWKPSFPLILKHGLIALAALGIAYGVVWALYAGPLEQDRLRTTKVISRTANTYGGTKNLNADNFRQVLLDTFVTSLINAEKPVLATHTLATSRVIRGATIALSFLLCMTGMIRLATLRRCQMLLALAGLSSFLAYLAFHWWFNPSEMILYTPPIILLWLLPFAAALAPSRYGTTLCTSVLLALLMLQLACESLTSTLLRDRILPTEGDRIIYPARWCVR